MVVEISGIESKVVLVGWQMVVEVNGIWWRLQAGAGDYRVAFINWMVL